MEIKETLDPFLKGSDAAKALRIPGAEMITTEGLTVVTLPLPGGGVVKSNPSSSKDGAAEEAFREWRKEMKKIKIRKKEGGL